MLKSNRGGAFDQNEAEEVGYELSFSGHQVSFQVSFLAHSSYSFCSQAILLS